jgi:hypothetical protein
VLVSPECRRLAVTAAWDVWPGREGGGLGALPGYLHWRQFRRLDAVLALNLNVRNAPEMLALAQQFDLGGFWWRGPRPVGKVTDLMNLLGDAGHPGLALDRMNPPTSLGSMTFAYPMWAEGQGVALQVTSQGRQGLILPPLKRAVLETLPWLEESPLTVLVAPGEVPAAVVNRLRPEHLIVYGSREPQAEKANPAGPSPYLTRHGAVTLSFSEKGATCNQWRPWKPSAFSGYLGGESAHLLLDVTGLAFGAGYLAAFIFADTHDADKLMAALAAHILIGRHSPSSRPQMI